MPELPEVETIRRELEAFLPGKTFAAPVLHAPASIAYPPPGHFSCRLAGLSIKSLLRRGKYLALVLDCGYLAVHLRMTGNLIYSPENKPANERFLRVSMPFTDESGLYFYDMRRFGRLWLLKDRSELENIVLKNTGPDIYSELDLNSFLSLLERRKRSSIKALLLDQRFVSGMGNIYTDECLFRCGLHPQTAVESLDESKGEELYLSIMSVLEEGIEHGGTTFRDYRSAAGALGDFQSRLAVYGRRGEQCRCGEVIKKNTVAGRGTYYCPRCQASPLKGKPAPRGKKKGGFS